MNSPFEFHRFPTLEVHIGSTLKIGAKNPISVQSMTSKDTMDTQAVVAEAVRMIEAGCTLVRLTAPSIKEAANLKLIKEELVKQGYTTPLVADIHFTPNAAMEAALHVEKVRINPGNYADKKRFEELEYTDESYQEELKRIEEKFLPLLELCKKNKVAMRIGVNHGSLSDRIMSRYGDTPEGMTESALEFLRICKKYDFDQVVISMKSSNPLVMVQAYRSLVAAFLKENMQYPLHLGVTEAGDGEDGRIKSALGIGTLLAEGIGDTIRVSLTEDPEFEMPVGEKLVQRFADWENLQEDLPHFEGLLPYNLLVYQKRATHKVLNIGGDAVPVVLMDRSTLSPTAASFFPLGYRYVVAEDKWHLSDQAADYIFIGDHSIDFEIPGSLGLVQNYAAWQKEVHKVRHYPLMDKKTYLAGEEKSAQLNFIEVTLEAAFDASFLEKIQKDNTAVLIFKTKNTNTTAETRRFFTELLQRQITTPVLLWKNYVTQDEETLMLEAAVDLGAPFLDGLGDGLALLAPQIPLQRVNAIAFGILQAARQRSSKTEYIACPSCGRTEFDLQSTTARIRAKTSHLKGLKIGIMGCIVNGPGEMADADYGYVGTGKGVITLYKQKQIVRRNVPEAEAVDALIDLIKAEGDWVEVPKELEMA